MEIRRIRLGEWGELRDLRLRALQDAPDAFSSTYEEESIRSDERWMEWTADLVVGGASFGVVAVDDDDRWIGMSVGAPHRDHPGEAGLFAMWVDPAARNAGIGAALIEDVVRWARTGGFPVLRLQVTLSNDAAVRLYLRSGFSDEGRRMPLREGSNVVTTMMMLDL
jgi:ribosomal protein S18 acetylase RimI-like enzyme